MLQADFSANTRLRLKSFKRNQHGAVCFNPRAIVTACATLEIKQDANTMPHFTHNGIVDTSYDQVREITTVRLDQIQVCGDPLTASLYIGGDKASFDASFSYSGRTLRAQPKRILFSFTSTSQNWKYTDFPKLTALVDGKPLNLGPFEHVPSFTVNASANTNSDDYISQRIAVSLSHKTFLRIANGTKVQIRMGPREFDLVGNHLEALRNLVTKMVP